VGATNGRPRSLAASTTYPLAVGADSISARGILRLSHNAHPCKNNRIIERRPTPWITTNAAAGKNPGPVIPHAPRAVAWAAALGWKNVVPPHSSRPGAEVPRAPIKRAAPAKIPRSARASHAPGRRSPMPAARNSRSTREKNGYTPGSPRRQRRVTQAEILRRTRRRRLLGVLTVLAVLAIGAFVSVNLLFKVAIFRVENFDRTTPANTGIYTEDEIIAALDIEKNSNLFGFSTAEKTQQLQAQFPYLDKVEVAVQMPATVVVRLTPATERFTCMYSGGWMVLSDSLRILRLEVSQPDGLILLSAKLPENFSPAIGQQVIPETYNSLLANAASSAASDSTDATPESAQPAVTDIVTQLWQLLQDDGLLDGLTALNISDTSQLSFNYQGRVDVLLGNSSSLDYKLRMAAKILTDPDKGLSGSDRGTLDVSDQLEDGEIRGYFQPYEQPTPTPEPAPGA